jgi:tetratricopeptide (TPR) repeat protein
VRQLFVRTCLARSAELREASQYSAQDLARMAESTDPADKQELMELYGFLASDYDYRPVQPAQVPYGDFAVQLARSSKAPSLLHNHGAIQSLERMLGLVRGGGIILVNDYGQAQDLTAEGFEHQRFADATAVGLNFPLLRAYFEKASRWLEPPVEGTPPSVHARLLGNAIGPETGACFLDRFGPAALVALEAPAQRAREVLQQGRLEAALMLYREALERQPANWALMNEVAHFLTYTLRSPAAGVEMARAALARNPCCSADLWNILGDSLFEMGRIDESGEAYRRALQISASDVRARYNLAFVHVHKAEHALALQRIAEALALDQTGSYREGLLRKQSEVLARLDRGRQRDFQLLANRISAVGLGEPKQAPKAPSVATVPESQPGAPRSGAVPS